MTGDAPIYFGKGVPVAHWPRFAFLSEHGAVIREQTRRERKAQGLDERVELIL